MTNRVRIQDSKKYFTIFTDRTHGGTSLEKGHLELMVQRRIRNPLEARSIFERGQFQTGTGTHSSSDQAFGLCPWTD